MFSGKKFLVALAQINSKTGDFSGNARKIINVYEKAAEVKASVLIVSPMALSGLNIRGLSLDNDFNIHLNRQLKELAGKVFGPTSLILTLPNFQEVKQILITDRTIQEVPKKMPFRIFFTSEHYGDERMAQVSGIYVKALGSFDEFVYTGGSLVINPDGKRVFQQPYFEEDVCVLEFENRLDGCYCVTSNKTHIYHEYEFLWNVLMMGLRDYMAKSGFSDVVLGMSGGMDSAFVAALAVDALGKEKVHCFALPSRYSSNLSYRLANRQCERLGIRLDKIPIEVLFNTFDKELHPYFKGRPADVTEENMQARIRAVLLMALSNKFGHILLATGNKSERAVGYNTLYGDTCGGFNPIADVYKTNIYHLAEWRNCNRPELALGSDGEVILEDIIKRPPTAELRENQKDSDNMPEYPILDAILHGLLEEEKSPSELYYAFDKDIVDRVYRLLVKSEFKRKQGCLGTIVSSRPLNSSYYDRPVVRTLL